MAPTTSDTFDELAAMFLTHPAGETQISHAGGHAPQVTSHRGAAPQRAERPMIELLWVGHLPVRGNLWLTPFADAISRQRGATALVRIDNHEPSLQLVRAPAHLSTAALSGDLISAMTAVSSWIDHWILRAPGNLSVAQMIHSGADRITILTSADEAAIVATYQMVKEYSQAAQESDVRLPALGLAVVGAEPAAASALVERLNRTSLSFLGVNIELVMCMPRMDAGVKSTRYVSFAGQQNPPLESVLTLLRSLRDAEVQSAGQQGPVAGRLYADREPAPIPRESPKPSVAPSVVAADPVSEPIQPKQQSVPAAEAARSRPAIKLAPKPAVQIEAKAPSQPTQPDVHGQPVSLANYVEGLRPLAFRPPGHEHVELAVDQEGGLHLLTREASLRELPVVQMWAMAHREILALASTQHPINTLAHVQCHVFTDRPVSVADLHGTEFHLHVLAPVTVDGRTAWYAAQLSR